ncbi:MAG TPA: hypothetical protein ENJ23_03735, partial [Bacteroidetes bacterium]|nr:hypothetical protein [Bacteroidota bacterium]
MKKFLWKILFLWAGCLPLAATAKSYSALEKISGPELKLVQIIQAQSGDDFWALDRRGILFHFARGRWTAYPIPQNDRLAGFNAAAVGRSEFLASGFDENWHTRFYWFRNGRWWKDNLELT